ncbi:PfaD family polyunsaturated fatty acid/polyketide biosynthesis protein [Pseudomonas mucidolens]|uniref:[acyl-carrier-protein] S-malonyltransferase n=1 Tax=Pseudomonas mucidolens TaxID=46679 RepID=A0A1H2MCK4_9PSED|nr:PfaD family polyunsaturated fatty acid/polyketide biosynthesis protein [Pseudomonas mucidolens]SDU90970.1 trans-AT polyketide synthase, acyltransferase and oxidoreductase domain-containing protein [Pseudomonas mucidolens]SQH34119.1 malonyl CoA-ACP transacylase [Pseudomonas mucidolens]
MNVLLFQGQGAQFKGMGNTLWKTYPHIEELASEVLGYSIKQLCLDDPDDRLRQTQYTQPALYTVNALHYYQWQTLGKPLDAVVGHSLGEFSALHAAGCFDFETGLRLVQKRGQLMSQTPAGSMAAVVGMNVRDLQALLAEPGFEGIDIANFNSPTQTVIAGTTQSILAAAQRLDVEGGQCIVLNVSAAFHSRHMEPVQAAFADFVQGFAFKDPRVPVIANVTARPYPAGQVADLLCRQISSPVQWVESIRYVLGMGDFVTHEVGADTARSNGTVLSKLVEEIRRTATPVIVAESVPESESEPNAAQRLGSQAFRARYGLKYAYVAGAMGHGITTSALVVRMAQGAMMSYLGTHGVSLSEVEQTVRQTQERLLPGQPYGVNLLNSADQPERARAIVDLCLRCHVACLEVSGFSDITRELVLFRAKGLSREGSGRLRCEHRLLAKVSHLESAEVFMSPAPAYLLQLLLAEGAISADQALWARQIPMSDDICVEANCSVPALALLTPVLQLRTALCERHGYAHPLCVGLAGGVGSPEAAAAAFMTGADFILTGSINQCTAEAGTCDAVKDRLQEISAYDTTWAPQGELFERGGQVQVLKKGSLFAQRAHRLYLLYSHYASLQDLPESERRSLEHDVFKRSLDAVWNNGLSQLTAQGRHQEIQRARAHPKVRMAHVFREYFNYTAQQAVDGGDDIYNYQVHTSPALGAFNQWVKGTALEPWRQRHVDEVASSLMLAAAQHLSSGYERLQQTALTA